MKKELSPGLMTVIGIVAAVVLIGGGVFWLGRTTGTSEDPELARKQWEVEKSRTPGGGATPTTPTVAPTGMAPGRDAELAAREQRGGN
jgi:hypothetical protein